jgi:hypothetical protein
LETTLWTPPRAPSVVCWRSEKRRVDWQPSRSAALCATYWFMIDQEGCRIVIQAVFFGGQDDVRHMLARLLRDGGKAK